MSRLEEKQVRHQLNSFIMAVTKEERRLRIKRRIRKRVKGTTERPRLSVYRSNNAIHAQIIDDVKGITLVSASSLSSKELSDKPKKEQSKVVGEKVGVPVFEMGNQTNPVEIAKAGLAHAIHFNNDVVILDTAGRLHIDENLMQELIQIKETVSPKEILLVLDAMTGQDAVNVAEHFNAQLEISGVILTKLDGDTRGGAALSVRAVTGKPIKYACVGEKLTDIEEFYPDRMASRILGMGDVLTLIEKAQENFDEEKAKKLEKKIKTSTFDLEDFLDQLEQLQKMGPIGDLLGMIPGMNNNKALKGVDVNDKDLIRTKAIIQSMTRKERMDPDIINGSRKKRIAAGCGVHVSEVNRLLKQFEQTKKMMKQFGGMEKKMKRGGGFKFPI